LVVDDDDETGSRPPSLSMSASSAEEDAMLPSMLKDGLEIFIDRDPKMFGSIITFLREGRLPLSLTAPKANDDLTLHTFSSQQLVWALVCELRRLEKEAEWFGMNRLQEMVRDEARKMVALAKRVEEDRLGKEKEQTRREKEKAGWI
jgi:hypothetical protein